MFMPVINWRFEENRFSSMETTAHSCTTETNVQRFHQCGRWSLRWTKSRQDRVKPNSSTDSHDFSRFHLTTVQRSYQCGRWSLRWTKRRQYRVVRVTTAPRNNKWKRSPCQSAGNSSSGENELPSLTAIEFPIVENVYDSATNAGDDSKSSDTDTGDTYSGSSGEVLQQLPNASKEVFPGIAQCVKVLNKLEGIDKFQYNKAITEIISSKCWRKDFIALPEHCKADFVKSLP